MRTLKYTSQYRKDERCVKRQGKDISKLDKILLLLITGAQLPSEYKDHSLQGNWKHSRELHIEPNWLLIYRLTENKTFVILERTGSHNELFK
ncbi:MAG: type II toxin-antitoxin system YafQ family toxin [Oscillospiraceae bacterium]|nr:type II toxin-antitoxin system YafQ family toxin [Oscillospiraceae bacterium]